MVIEEKTDDKVNESLVDSAIEIQEIPIEENTINSPDEIEENTEKVFVDGAG